MTNRFSVGSRLLATAAAALSSAGALVALDTTAAQAAPTPACSGQYKIDKALPNGARWTMCWQLKTAMGVVLERVIYTPRGGTPHQVLSSGALGQIHVPYDSGQAEFNDLGAYGELTEALTAKDCPGGELREHQGRKLLCVRTTPRGYAYKRFDYDDDGNVLSKDLQGDELVLHSAAPVGWYTYITEWRFADDGAITPRVGATGSLAPDFFTDAASGWPVGAGSTRFSENHSHNVSWRLDFDVDGTTNDVVEQFDFTGSGTQKRTLKASTLTTEAARDKAPMRYWRVKDKAVKNTDQHNISWEIELRDTDQWRGDAAHGFTHHDLFVTQYKACEQLVAGNEDGTCADAVDKFVNNEALADPVVWPVVGFHHVPRDEDEDPMPVHWQGLRIVPRDLTARSPLP
jgi:primary-amine oxidase